MKCPLCGETTSKDDIYCGNCGYNLSQDEPEEEPGDEAEEQRVDVGEGIPLVAALDDDESPFSLVDIDEDEPAGPDKRWRTILIAAIVLFVVLCCCCSASLIILATMGEGSY